MRQKCNLPRNVTFLATSEKLGPPGRRSDSAARTMRVGPMFGLEALLGRFGVPLAPLIAETGLPPDCFSHPDDRWPVDKLLDLVARFRVLSGSPDVPFLVGQMGKFPGVPWTPGRALP